MTITKPSIMIDLETLSTNPKAKVLSGGFCLFDINGVVKNTEKFYYEFDISKQKDREELQSTKDWWKTQPIPVPDKGIDDLEEMFVDLKDNYVEGSTVWSQSSMDMEILKDLAKEFGYEIPWPHWKVRDSRTFRNELSELGVPWGTVPKTAHNALKDAEVQADHVAFMSRQVEQRFRRKWYHFWK